MEVTLLRGRGEDAQGEQGTDGRQEASAAAGRAAEGLLRGVLVASLGSVAPAVVEGAAGRVAEVRVEDGVHRCLLFGPGPERIERRAKKGDRGIGRQQAPRLAQLVGIVAGVHRVGVCRPVARFVELPVHLVDPVEDHRDLHPVGGAIGVREAVLDRVERLPMRT